MSELHLAHIFVIEHQTVCTSSSRRALGKNNSSPQNLRTVSKKKNQKYAEPLYSFTHVGKKVLAFFLFVTLLALVDGCASPGLVRLASVGFTIISHLVKVCVGFMNVLALKQTLGCGFYWEQGMET